MFFYNLLIKTRGQIAQLPAKPISNILVSDSGAQIALLNNSGDLHIFSAESQKLEQIAHNAEIFAFSPDSKKIAFADADGKLNVHFIEDWNKNIRKKAGETINIKYQTSNAKPIKNIVWHKDSFHLFAELGDEIRIIEIDDRPLLNEYLLVQEIKDFYYDLKSDIVYFIQNENLYSLEI